MARSKPGTLLYRRPDGSEEHIQLRSDVTTFGRSTTCGVVIPLPIVSRLHALVELQHDRYIILDAGSANGTFVNGRRIEQPYQLGTGDQIWLGASDVALDFSDPEETLMVARHRAPPALLIDESARVVEVHGAHCPLSPLEYSMLLHLASNPGTVCTREACFLVVWGQHYDHATCEDALNACVAKLRRNLRTAADATEHDPPSITTIPRVGFRLDADVAFTPRSDQLSAERSLGE